MWRWGKREIIHPSLQSDSCIKMGSDDSHFNVLLIVRDKITRQFVRDQLTSHLLISPGPTSDRPTVRESPAHLPPLDLAWTLFETIRLIRDGF